MPLLLKAFNHCWWMYICIEGHCVTIIVFKKCKFRYCIMQYSNYVGIMKNSPKISPQNHYFVVVFFLQSPYFDQKDQKVFRSALILSTKLQCNLKFLN